MSSSIFFIKSFPLYANLEYSILDELQKSLIYSNKNAFQSQQESKTPLATSLLKRTVFFPSTSSKTISKLVMITNRKNENLMKYSLASLREMDNDDHVDIEVQHQCPYDKYLRSTVATATDDISNTYSSISQRTPIGTPTEISTIEIPNADNCINGLISIPQESAPPFPMGGPYHHNLCYHHETHENEHVSKTREIQSEEEKTEGHYSCNQQPPSIPIDVIHYRLFSRRFLVAQSMVRTIALL